MSFDEEVVRHQNLKLEEVQEELSTRSSTAPRTRPSPLSVIFDSEEATAAPQPQFQILDEPGTYERLADAFRELRTGNVWNWKRRIKYNATHLPGRTETAYERRYPDYPKVADVGQLHVGRRLYNSRLVIRIRQEGRAQLRVGSGPFFADQRDETATWQTYAIYAPENGSPGKGIPRKRSKSR